MKKCVVYFLVVISVFGLLAVTGQKSLSNSQTLQDSELIAELRRLKSPLPPERTTDDIDAERRKFSQYCQGAYSDYYRKLNRLRLPYFEQVVLARALKNPLVPEENKQFLSELLVQLKAGGIGSNENYATDQLLFSLMSQEGLPLGIFSDYHTSCKGNYGNTDCKTVNPEKTLAEPIPDSVYFKLVDTDMPYLFHDEVVAQSPYLNSQEFNIYGRSGKSKARLTSFATSLNECTESFYYGIDQADTEFLIGTKSELVLEYGVFPKADSTLLSSQTKCLDCPESQDFQTFAKLAGVEELFFTFTDSKPTPGRQLMINMEGHWRALWSSGLDLFGCSCL